jgi:hypothetical protein
LFVPSLNPIYLYRWVQRNITHGRRDNIKRAIIAVRNKGINLLGASVLCELPKSTIEDRFNSKEKLFKKKSLFEVVESLSQVRQISGLFSERAYLDEIRNIVLTISNVLLIPLLLKKSKNEREIQITVIYTKVLPSRNVFIASIS